MVLPGRDLPWRRFLVLLKDEYLADDIGNVAGTLTFFAVLALFPFLLFLVALGALMMNPSSIESAIEPLTRVAPQAVVTIVDERLTSLALNKSLSLLTGTALFTLFSASGAMMSLIDALNRAYGVKDSRSWLKRRLLAVVMTLFTAVFAIVAALAAVFLLPLAGRVGGHLGTALVWLRLPVAALLMMFLWAVLYYVLPDVEQRFRFITPGSVAGVVLWVVASWGFSQYVAHFGSYEVTYGALGGVVVLFLWMWISSQVVLVGAEINAILEHKSAEGKRAGKKSFADTGVSGTKTEERGKRRPKVVVVHAEPAPKKAVELGLAALVFRLLRRSRRA